MKWFKKSQPVEKPITQEERKPLDDSAEVVMLKQLLDQSLDSKKFTDAVLQHGFTFIQESVMGLKMESDKGRLMLGVFGKVHESNIATLVYLDKERKQTICLVDGGRKQY